MQNVDIYIFGKKYSVPSTLTIMTAMEYAGYKLVRGVGCRNGFCGACAVIYRIIEEPRENDPKLNNGLKFALACRTSVQNNMYIATLPFFPLLRKSCDLNKIPDKNIFLRLYPEIYKCLGCGACTKSCPKNINVMQYIAYAQRGDFKNCAETSFDCVMCGICSARCPAGISHPNVAMLARRVNGKFLSPPSKALKQKVMEINEGKYEEEFKNLLSKSKDEIKNIYDKRDIEGGD